MVPEMVPEAVLWVCGLSHNSCSAVCCFQQFIQMAEVVKLKSKISWSRRACHSGRFFHGGIASLRTWLCSFRPVPLCVLTLIFIIWYLWNQGKTGEYQAHTNDETHRIQNVLICNEKYSQQTRIHISASPSILSSIRNCHYNQKFSWSPELEQREWVDLNRQYHQ